MSRGEGNAPCTTLCAEVVVTRHYPTWGVTTRTDVQGLHGMPAWLRGSRDQVLHPRHNCTLYNRHDSHARLPSSFPC